MVRRQLIVVVTLALLLVPGLIFPPVNAEDYAGPDTSGSDLDIGRIATELLDDNMMVLISPPHYQWTADRYVEEGQQCADRCKALREKYRTLPEGDPAVGQTFNQGMAFCECAQKNYNKAFELTKKDDYEKQAEIFEAGTSLYESMGMTNEAENTRNAASVARAHATASHFFLPLPPLLAVFGILMGIFLLHHRRS